MHARRITEFPFLFGGTFIEGAPLVRGLQRSQSYFPSFSEGLSLRGRLRSLLLLRLVHFPSFSEGLSLRVSKSGFYSDQFGNFPSFSEGLSLRAGRNDGGLPGRPAHFPSFSEGLSLRVVPVLPIRYQHRDFPSFSEGLSLRASLGTMIRVPVTRISLPFRRDFH